MRGVSERFALAQQRPFTTRAALSVRPDGSLEGRERGGSRPGLRKSFAPPPETPPTTNIVATAPRFYVGMRGDDVVFNSNTYEIVTYHGNMRVTVSGDASDESGAFTIDRSATLEASTAASGGRTTIETTKHVFRQDMEDDSDTITFSAGGTYIIDEYRSASKVRVAGDATGEHRTALTIKKSAVADSTTLNPPPTSLEGSPIRMLASVNIVPFEARWVNWRDDFSAYAGGAMNNPWIQAPRRLSTNPVPAMPLVNVSDRMYTAWTSNTEHDGMYAMLPVLGVDPDFAFNARMHLWFPSRGYGIYWLYIGLDPAAPTIFDNCLSASLRWYPDSNSGDIRLLRHINDQAFIWDSASFAVGPLPGATLHLQIKPAPAGGGLFDILVQAGSGATITTTRQLDDLPGRSIVIGGDPAHYSLPPEDDIRTLEQTVVERFTYSYQLPGSLTNKGRDLLVISAGGKLYRDDDEGNLVEVTNAVALSSDKTLEATAHLQKLYIADYGDGVVPKVYDPAAEVMQDWVADEGRGTVPIGNRLIARYRGGMVLAAADDTPHLWYMSRRGAISEPGRPAISGNPNDWLDTFDTGDQGRPISGLNADAGEVGEPITALVPHSDDYLIFGCRNSLWLLRGDPAAGGLIANLSRKVGIIGAQAWTYGPNNELVFLSRDGLYGLAPGAATFPESISRELLPNALLDVDIASMTVLLEYDINARGVHIFLTGIQATARQQFWYDWETRGFWPVSLQDAHMPTATIFYHATRTAESRVVLGCKDGVIRHFDKNSQDDDGFAIDNYVFYGPISLSGNDYVDGMVTELIGVPAIGGGSVNWSLHVGDSQEEAFVAPASDSGTWAPGISSTDRPRVRGNTAFLRLSGNGESWAMERITMVRRSLGKQRS